MSTTQQNTTPWSIEVLPEQVPGDVRREHQGVVGEVFGTDWEPRLVDTDVDTVGRSCASYFTVLVRRKARFTAKVSETLATISPNSDVNRAGQDVIETSGQIPYGRGTMA